MSVHVLQYWILHNYSHHNEEANCETTMHETDNNYVWAEITGPPWAEITGYQRESTTTYQIIRYMEYAAYKTNTGAHTDIEKCN